MAYAKNENIPSHQHRDFATWQEHSAGIAEQGRGRPAWLALFGVTLLRKM